MKAFFEALEAAMLRGENAVLCSVLAASGSTPRGAGAKMAVFADGRILGTVGGGAVEQLAIKRALRVLAGADAGCERFCLTPGQLGDIGMVCGGDVCVSFRLLRAENEADCTALREICQALAQTEHAWLVYRMQGGAVASFGVQRARDAAPDGMPQQLLQPAPVYLPDEGWYAEPLVRAGTVYICGGGHVGRALAALLLQVGFRVSVYDERPELARAESFPQAGQVLCGPFEAFSARVPITADDYIVIMTPGHLADRTVLRQALATDACYIGCIGSSRKVAVTNAALRAEGFSGEQLARIHAPIGLEIFAETPAEIAVSIAAELIRLRAVRAGTRKARRAEIEKKPATVQAAEEEARI